MTQKSDQNVQKPEISLFSSLNLQKKVHMGDWAGNDKKPSIENEGRVKKGPKRGQKRVEKRGKIVIEFFLWFYVLFVK